jgi:hypothetical protein
MKNMMLILLFPTMLLGQVIPEKWHYVISPEGDTVDIKLVEDRGMYFDFIIKSDTTQKVRTMPANLGNSNLRPLWEVPFNIDPESGQVQYSGIVQVPNVNASQLYTALRVWFADIFKDSRSVLEVDDKESGILMGRGWTTVIAGELWFSIKVQIKDGRYKYTISDLYVELPGGYGYSARKISLKDPDFLSMKFYRKYRAEVVDELQDLCDAIERDPKKFIQTKDEW